MPDDKTIGPLLACAIGDAYGAGFEYADKHLGLPEYRKRNDLSRYWPHPKWGQPPKDGSYIPTKPGCYTDDTQMSLAIADLLLGLDPAEWTHGDVAGAFVGVFKRDPRPGYAQGFYSVLQKVAGSEDFLKTVRPHSQKSGGAMRAALIGLLPTPMQVVDVAMMQASLTHASRDGMYAAAASALMLHYCYHNPGIPKTDLPKFIGRWVPGPDWETPWRGRAGSPGLESVKAAMWAVISHSTLSQVLRACVSYTGDVDTVAAIAMPSAALCKGIEHDIPQALIDGLENDAFGRDYIRDLDRKLLAKFPGKSRTNSKTRGRGKAPTTAAPEAPPPTETAETTPAPKDPENESGLGLLASLFED